MPCFQRGNWIIGDREPVEPVCRSFAGHQQALSFWTAAAASGGWAGRFVCVCVFFVHVLIWARSYGGCDLYRKQPMRSQNRHFGVPDVFGPGFLIPRSFVSCFMGRPEPCCCCCLHNCGRALGSVAKRLPSASASAGRPFRSDELPVASVCGLLRSL